MGPEETDWIGIVQTALLLIFAVCISIGAYTTTRRLIRYRALHEDVPLILWRDVIARNSLAFPFIAIFLVRAMRAFGLDVSFVEEWPWVLGTSLPPVFGAMVYAYFELFVIEREDHPEPYPGTNGNGHDTTQDQREDLRFGRQRRKLEAEHTRTREKP